MDSFVELMGDATLRPRTGFRDRLNGRRFGLPLLFSAASGVVQSMVQGASNNMGVRAAVSTLLLFAVPIGIAWGMIQVHVAAGALWVVARSGDGRIPFFKLRDMVALASAPNTYSFIAWLLASFALGRVIFTTPDAWPVIGISPPAALAVSLLYLGTAGCAIWAFFLLVLGVREVEEGSTWGDALITLLMAVLLLVAVAVAIGIAVVFLLGRFRGHAGIAA